MARLFKGLLAVAILVVLPGTVYGQASIAGVVRDSSGAVLPGVTVEAASEALIEKVRTAVTDGTGQYRIVDLRAGTYDVTFTLQGFSTVRREGIQLTGDFTATVNAELRLGSLEETITVTGESPIVDVQSARRQATIESEVLRSLPIDRTWRSAAVLVPGIIVSGTEDVGGMSGPSSPIFTFRGGRDKEGRAQVDGLSVGASLGGSGVSGYISDVGTAEEVTVTTSGHLGEAEVSGPVVNVVPRVGGNTLSGIVFGGGANGAMQGDNYTAEHREIGLREPAKLIKMWDVNASLGGPIIRDRLWYYGNARHQGNEQYVTNMYANLNAGNPDAWTYEPDFTQQARNDGIWTSLSLRLTLQATERNKFNLFWDEQTSCRPRKWGGSATTSPEATPLGYCDGPWRSQQATWTSPVTNRLLFEAAYGTVFLRWGTKERDNTRHLIRVQEQAGLIPGLTYRSQDWADGWIGTHTWRASTSYVTGAHSMKIGHQGAFYVNDQTRHTNDHRLRYRFNNGVPNQLTMIGIPPPLPEQVSHSRAAYTALYAQEQWTAGRLTLQGALRYDYAWSYFPAHQIGPERFIPEPLIFPRMSGVKGYHDITPRMAAAYDVFGNASTSLRISLGKYLEAVSNNQNYTGPSPELRMSLATTRSWNDANRDYVPDCDLLNPDTNGECGPWANRNFGQSVFSSTYDPAILEGWGVRPNDWSFGASVQQRLSARMSAEVGYYRRWLHNFTVVDNRSLQAADFEPFAITAPLDPRLPGGGGHTVSGLYNIVPDKFGLVDDFVTYAENYGEQTRYWHGVDVTVNARLQNGLTIQGGTSTGQTVTDSCEIRAALPEIDPLDPYCHVATGFQTQGKALIAYSIPRLDVTVSATYRDQPGPQLAANWVVPNAIIAPSLGRDLAGGAANATVNLIEPGTLYGDRIRLTEVRIAKIFRVADTRTQLAVDVHNLFNSSTSQTYNQTFGPRWLTPTLVLPARFVRISAQLDF